MYQVNHEGLTVDIQIVDIFHLDEIRVPESFFSLSDIGLDKIRGSVCPTLYGQI
jgi:hypothetical protein